MLHHAPMPDIDLLKNADERGTPTGQPRQRPKLGRLLIGLAVALLIAGASFGYRIVRSSSAISTATQSGLSGIITQIKYLVSSGDRPILGEREDRINVLLLGMGGVGHEGAYLTDTIIVASVKPSTHEVAMLSVPRDLYVPIPGYGWRKINNANAFGREQDYPGGGEALATAVVEEVTGLDVPYYARVDFT
ncbi:MAG: LCP family protein, partial [Candidatus Kerfeldbacteria bacterium]|nr:LCP family protein [Candidatus Kerfeldbacteria bacterium]